MDCDDLVAGQVSIYDALLDDCLRDSFSENLSPLDVLTSAKAVRSQTPAFCHDVCFRNAVVKEKRASVS